MTSAVKVSDIDYNGQQAALNDCLYRNKHKAKYLITIDLDGLIIPQMEKDFTLLDIIERFPAASSYMFRHVTYYWDKNSKNF